MRLMIVDDHPGTREMIWTFLTLPGATFCECASGNEALDRVREFKPDWVTMGISMPGLDGFQSTKALLLEYPSARVVIVSSLDEPHLRQSAHDAGATYFILLESILALRMILVREMTAGIPPAAGHD
jgi:DNA-binding NarL/FixJ family response regulator